MAVIHVPGTRSVGSQVRRAIALTLGTVAVLCLAAAGVSYGAAPAAEAWARVVGDPAVTLADGAVLADMPGRSVEIRLEQVPVDAAMIEAAFGAPARELTTQEQLDAAGVETGVGDLGTLRYFAVAGGVVRTASSPAPGAIAGITLHPEGTGRLTIRGTTPDQRAQVMRRAVAALGPASGSPSVGVDIVERSIDSTTAVTALPTVAGLACDTCGIPWSDSGWSPDGSLKWLTVWAVRATGSTPVATISANEAFDLVRHHREDAVVGTGGPVVRAVLNPAVVQPGLSMPATWAFYDAAGLLVGQVTAQPGRTVVVDESAGQVTVG